MNTTLPRTREYSSNPSTLTARGTWDIEGAGLNNFRRMNVPLEIFAIGDTVKVAGWPSKRSSSRMYGANLLADDGPELVIGAPMSPAAKLVERFAPSADGSRLNYTLVITDPDSLTAPVEGKRSWVWRPGEKVMPFNCNANVP